MGQLCLRMCGRDLCEHAFCHQSKTKSCKMGPLCMVVINLAECRLMKATGYLDKYKMIICNRCYEQNPDEYLVLTNKQRDVLRHVKSRKLR